MTLCNAAPLLLLLLPLATAIRNRPLYDGESENPEAAGLKGRITQLGFDYASELGMDMIMDQLSSLTIPDVTETSGLISATISNIRVVEFPRPSSRLRTVTAYGLKWEGFNMNPTIEADYHAEIGFGWWTTQKSGSLRAVGRGLNFDLAFSVGRADDGRPRTFGEACYADGDISIDFTGGWSDALNLGSSVFKYPLQNYITSKICEIAKAETQGRLNAELASLPVHETVEEFYDINFGMTEYPLFTVDAMEIFSKGAISVIGHDEDPPFAPTHIPTNSNHSLRMVYGYISDFVLNSGMYAAYHNGHLAYNLTESRLAEDAQQYLDLSCPRSRMCVGSVFPQLASIGGLLGGSRAAIDVYAIAPPSVRIHGNWLHLHAQGEASVYADLLGERQFIAALSLNVTGAVQIDIIGNRVVFNVSNVQPNADIKQTMVGRIGTGAYFDRLVNMAVKRMLVPELEALGAEGIVIPSVAGVEFVNPTILDENTEGVFVIATDVAYTLPAFDDK